MEFCRWNSRAEILYLALASSLFRILIESENLQIVLKLFASARVTSLSRLEQVLPESDQLHVLVQAGEDASSALSHLPASPKYWSGVKFSDRPETLRICSVDFPEWIGTGSPGLGSTSFFVASRRRHLVCSVSSSSFSKIFLPLGVARLSQNFFQLLSGGSRAHPRGFSQDLDSSTIWYFPEKT